MGLQKMVKKGHKFLRCCFVVSLWEFFYNSRRRFPLSAVHYANIFSAGPFHELFT